MCALTCVTKVVQIIEDLNKKSYKNIKIWSDGCAAQFRSKFVFYLVAETLLPTKNISWNYNEPHHGKGPMDGLGGTLKRKVFNAVKSGKVVVNDPEEFAMAAVNIVSGVHTIYLKESDLLMEPEEIKDAPSIKGTLNVHRFDRHTNKKGVRYLKFYHLSDDDHEFFTQWYPKEGIIICGHEDKEISKNICGKCGELYTKGQAWSKCRSCLNWFHDECFYNNV